MASSSSSSVRQRLVSAQQSQLQQEQQQEPSSPKQQPVGGAAASPPPPQSPLYQALTSTANLLPTGTLLAFNLLAPSFTNHGAPHRRPPRSPLPLLRPRFLHRLPQGTRRPRLLRRRHARGLWLLDYPPGDTSRYRLAFVDFVHAALSAAVFGVVAARDKNVVRCYCPAPGKKTEEVLDILPLGVGVLCSLLFVAFPTRRHGIGYPVTNGN